MLENVFDSSVPCHLVDTLSRTGAVLVSMAHDHAPDRIISFLYGGPELHKAIMAMNSKSPLSVRQGDQFQVYDKSVLTSLASGD